MEEFIKQHAILSKETFDRIYCGELHRMAQLLYLDRHKEFTLVNTFWSEFNKDLEAFKNGLNKFYNIECSYECIESKVENVNPSVKFKITNREVGVLIEIGETFKEGNIELKCVKVDTEQCVDCAFVGHYALCDKYKCNTKERFDSEEVIFKVTKN